MKQGNDFFYDLLDLDAAENEQVLIWRACFPESARQEGADVLLDVPFRHLTRVAREPFHDFTDGPVRRLQVRLRAYGPATLRCTVADGCTPLSDAENPMLDWHDSIRTPEPLRIREQEWGWEIIDQQGLVRAIFDRRVAPSRPWREDIAAKPVDSFRATLYPDGKTAVPFMDWDFFGYGRAESVPLGFVERNGNSVHSLLAFRAAPDEKFAGTGERFAKLDLSGRTMTLENTDAMGVNNRRCYKNIPFYVSSRPYGLFMNTSYPIRLSLADISTRAAQAMIEEPVVDCFIFGGGSVERVLYNYRCVTGFPSELPCWSYGTWMSRMTYYTDTEVRTIARRLRAESFPCDVLHLDTGWFAKDWVCEWRFGKDNFPDPAGFMADMRAQGFRITLWQTPTIGEGNCLLAEAKTKSYLAPLTADPTDAGTGSDFSNQAVAGQIDFSNPAAVHWYQDLLANLLRLGVSAIKTDFGEDIDPNADYYGMPAQRLHNLYALLYQRAAFEVTRQVTGEGIIWARAGWAGCQRYPLHWGGDSACTWDGMIGSLRGGLHLGLSGFGFWSHDVPGFHGVPDFMGSWPADDLYIRWTQFGVFTSHLRYHGTTPREPYEYPAVADIVRRWLQLRYALIPYLMEQARKTCTTGLPLLRALLLHHEADQTAWITDDEFYCGDDFLVAPIFNSTGIRDVYLPSGTWVDFWTGQHITGPVTLRRESVPLAKMPVYVRAGASIPIYPEPVNSTMEMDSEKIGTLEIDQDFQGIAESALAWIFQNL